MNTDTRMSDRGYVPMGTKPDCCFYPPLSAFIRVHPCPRPDSASGKLPLDLAVPALGPLVTLLVGGVPVDVDELGRALADGRHVQLLAVHLRVPVPRAVAVLDGEHLLELRIDEGLHEVLREWRGIGFR